jgi:tetratricopeptide (TPR) repeat protein
LLRSSRREIHTRIASITEQERPDIVAAQPEFLGYHYGLAGNAEAAVRYWLLGGRRARGRSTNLEAAIQFQKALEFLELLPATPERHATELEIQLSLGLCFIAVRGYSSDDTCKAFERACDLSAELGDPHKELQAIFGLWGHCWMRADHDRAVELAEMLLAKADQLRDLTALALGHRSLGSTLFTRGDFIRARQHLERAVSLGQQSTTDRTLSYAVDPRIAARLMLGWDLWILGFPEQALRNVLQALSQAIQYDDAYTSALAHYVTSAVQLLRGDAHDALANADQSLALSTEHRINLFALYSRFGRGCALAKLGHKERAIFEIREGIEEARRSNLGYMRGVMLGWLATLQADTGTPEAGLSTINEALRQTNDVTGRAWEAELRRLRAEILLAARPDAGVEAELSYNNAIVVARDQGARSLELRATTSLARFLRAQGRIEEARARLGPICDWFTEGFDTADLKEARQLKDELS